MNASIVVVGSLNMDLVLQVERAPGPGETLPGRTFTQVSGGKGANQAIASARLGGHVAMVGRVGDDAFGAQLRTGLTRDGVDVEHVGIATQLNSGIAAIIVEKSGENRIVIVPGANGTLTPAHIDAAREVIERADIVLLQLEVPMPAVERAIDIATNAGRRVLLNPAPACALEDELLSRIDYLVPNETEAGLLTGIAVVDYTSAVAAALALRQRGVRRVLVTLGSKGVLIADERGVREIPAPSVEAIDTTAAGDTFIGAFAVATTEEQGIDAAARFAVQAASLSVTRHGAQTSIPRRHEM